MALSPRRLAVKTARAAAKKAAKKADLAVKPKPAAAKRQAPAVITARAGTKRATAKDVLAEAAKPSKSAPTYAEWRAKNPESGTLLDLSSLAVIPDVEQRQIPRYDPARGPSPRIVDALADPAVAEGINLTVKRGLEGGGAEWYNTDPLHQRMFDVMPSVDVDPAYARLMDIVAATSPRARVPDNVRTASYYNYLMSQGEDIGDKPAKGYGSVAQNLHRDNVLRLAELGGWDVFANPKPASFSQNLQGNQHVVTIDTHNFRLPGILAKDPRFLETSIAELAPDRETALQTLSRQYPGLPDEVVDMAVKERPGKTSITYRPQEWVDKGYISLDDAANDPALWAAKPRDNEYGYYEQWQQQQAKDMGISPAQYQAAMWLGGGETTGLGSAAEPFLGTLEARVRYTADRLGMDPEVVMEMFLRGEIPMLAKGGLAVKRGACAS